MDEIANHDGQRLCQLLNQLHFRLLARHYLRTCSIPDTGCALMNTGTAVVSHEFVYPPVAAKTVLILFSSTAGMGTILFLNF